MNHMRFFCVSEYCFEFILVRFTMMIRESLRRKMLPLVKVVSEIER